MARFRLHTADGCRGLTNVWGSKVFTLYYRQIDRHNWSNDCATILGNSQAAEIHRPPAADWQQGHLPEAATQGQAH